MYRVIKVLNNNGILVLDDANGQEQILLGNGVGFGHRMESGWQNFLRDAVMNL